MVHGWPLPLRGAPHAHSLTLPLSSHLILPSPPPLCALRISITPIVVHTTPASSSVHYNSPLFPRQARQRRLRRVRGRIASIAYRPPSPPAGRGAPYHLPYLDYISSVFVLPPRGRHERNPNSPFRAPCAMRRPFGGLLGQERSMHAHPSGGTFGGRSQLDSRRRAACAEDGRECACPDSRAGVARAAGRRVVSPCGRRARVCYASVWPLPPLTAVGGAVSDTIVQIRARCVQRPASTPRREHTRGLERGSASGGLTRMNGRGICRSGQGRVRTLFLRALGPAC